MKNFLLSLFVSVIALLYMPTAEAVTYNYPGIQYCQNCNSGQSNTQQAFYLKASLQYCNGNTCAYSVNDQVKFVLHNYSNDLCEVKHYNVRFNVTDIDVVTVDGVPVSYTPSYGGYSWQFICTFPNPNAPQSCGNAR